MAGKVKQISCHKCKGTLTIRAEGYTKSLACQFCDTIHNIQDGSIGILKTQNYRVEPLIPLGARGKLHGFEWEMIGFMECMGSYDNPPSKFTWHEYLLFNPYKGFRWLTEYNGHWNYVCTLHEIPKNRWDQNVSYMNETFKYRETFKRSVSYVIGEFYWRVKIKDVSLIKEYSHKEGILSLETINNTSRQSRIIDNYGQSTLLHIGGIESPIKVSENNEKEEIWSFSEYVTPREIQKAFKLEESLPARKGIMINQPVPGSGSLTIIAKTSAGAGAAVLGIGILFATFAKPTLLFTDTITATSRDPLLIEPEYISPSFVIKENRLIQVAIESPVDNTWVEIDASIINEKTGKSTDFAVGLEYYYGYNDGSWVEGSRSNYWVFSALPEGRYHLNIKTETGAQSVPIKITMVEGIMGRANFLFSLLLVVAPAIFILIYYVLFSFVKYSKAYEDSGENILSTFLDD